MKNTEMSTTEKIIEDYYNPATGLTSAKRFYDKIKDKYPDVSYKQFKAIMKDQFVNQVHYQKHRPKHYRPIVAPAINFIHQIDLMDISNKSHKNKGVNFLLCSVDVTSRFAQVAPLKNKEAKTVADAMKSFLKDTMPNVIQADQGSEFISKQF